MRKLNKYEKKYLYNLKGLNVIDKILMRVFPGYTYKIYKKGYKNGYDWSVSYTDNSN